MEVLTSINARGLAPGHAAARMNDKIADCVLDVRVMPPRDRHPRIFEAWEALPDGGVMLLVNDHDPLPLYYQFAAEYAGTFRWVYADRGPALWRVLISKGAFPEPGFVPAPRPTLTAKRPGAVGLSANGPVVLDVRPIFARGATPCGEIDEAVAGLRPGQPLVLVVPFEPVPLYAKLGALGFDHRTQQTADGAWRVEFTREGALAARSGSSCGCGHNHH